MDDQSAELFEKIRQQFDSAPYPRVSLEQHPRGRYDLLFQHSLVTPYYLRNQRLVETEGSVILDAGCGTGYKSLILAEANPGARIIGVDISSEAVELAKQRLAFHGHQNCEFLVAPIEDLPERGIEVDYINCDEVLYLLPDIVKGLQAMRAVLKPTGIIRANLHSATQRFHFFRAQQVFKLMGLMDGNPEELEIEIARETFKALHDWVSLKIHAWKDPSEKEMVDDNDWILVNYLLQGDKGYTIAELFSALRAADLEFISMVKWRKWELLNLFQDPENLPAFWAMSLPEVPIEQRLQLFELIHPAYRLLDFWCGHPDQTEPFVPVTDWSTADWQAARVHLHPQLRTAKMREDLLDCIKRSEPFEISRYVPDQTQTAIWVQNPLTACLLPLWDEPQSVQSLVERSLKLQPLDLITLELRTPDQALNELLDTLTTLEVHMYLLLEPAATP